MSATRYGEGLPRAYWVLWTGMLVNRLGGFVVPFLAIYLTRVRGLSLATAGAIVALWGAGSLASGPVGGILADRVGRRTTLLLGSTLGALSMVHLGVARAPAHVAVAAAMLGFFGDLSRPALQAAVADVVPPERRPRAYGLLYWAYNLGFSIAATVGGALVDVSFTLLFAADAATTLAFGAIVWRALPETRPAPRTAGAQASPSLWTPYRHGAFVAFVALTFVVSVAFHQFIVALPLDMIAHGLSPRAYGMLVAINGVLIVVVQPLVLRVVERLRPIHAQAIGALLTGVGLGMTALATAPPMYAASIVVWTLGEIAMAPVTPAIVAALAPAELRGSYQGAMQIAFGGALLLAPVVGTAILGAFGGPTLWGACVVAGALGALGLVALGRNRAFARAHAAPAEVAPATSGEGEPAELDAHARTSVSA